MKTSFTFLAIALLVVGLQACSDSGAQGPDPAKRGVVESKPAGPPPTTIRVIASAASPHLVYLTDIPPEGLMHMWIASEAKLGQIALLDLRDGSVKQVDIRKRAEAIFGVIHPRLTFEAAGSVKPSQRM
jgi:hypothetical protein